MILDRRYLNYLNESVKMAFQTTQPI